MTLTIDHVEIKQDLPGFERFMGTWVVRGPADIIVDVGPATTASRLIQALEDLGLVRLDLILLTHVHIDHAGALAQVLEHYPEARAVCHAQGRRFLEDPSKLWAGSLKVLGTLAEAYGRPAPVPPERVQSHDAEDWPGLTIIETPGHAPHHLSYRFAEHIFSGEAGGNLFLIHGRQYLRPATPVRFFLPEAMASVDRLLELPDSPIHYAHFDQAPHSRAMLGRFRAQLGRWREIIGGELDAGLIDLEERCVEALLAQDPELAAFPRMDAAAQTRERTFMANSIRGYLGYLKEDSGA